MLDAYSQAAIGAVEIVGPAETVSERPSVSIHLLANDTGCVVRHKYDPDAGAVIAFRSRYSNVRCSS